jgi:hypothetical protein
MPRPPEIFGGWAEVGGGWKRTRTSRTARTSRTTSKTEKRCCGLSLLSLLSLRSLSFTAAAPPPHPQLVAQPVGVPGGHDGSRVAEAAAQEVEVAGGGVGGFGAEGSRRPYALSDRRRGRARLRPPGGLRPSRRSRPAVGRGRFRGPRGSGGPGRSAGWAPAPAADRPSRSRRADRSRLRPDRGRRWTHTPACCAPRPVPGPRPPRAALRGRERNPGRRPGIDSRRALRRPASPRTPRLFGWEGLAFDAGDGRFVVSWRIPVSDRGEAGAD